MEQRFNPHRECGGNEGVCKRPPLHDGDCERYFHVRICKSFLLSGADKMDAYRKAKAAVYGGSIVLEDTWLEFEVRDITEGGAS